MTNNIIRIGEAASRLGQCFGVDSHLPFPIPVWVADVNCEEETYADELIQLRSAYGDGGQAEYADLKSGKKVTATSIFIRGEGYCSPNRTQLEDDYGKFHQPAQRRYSTGK